MSGGFKISDDLFTELYAKAEASIPKIQGEISIKDALKDSVEVIRDQWGIPHLFAKNNIDLFFTQGYITAQDRLWQMELLRRTAAGRLSEIFGDSILSSDIFYRNLGISRAAEHQMQLFFKNEREENKSLVEAYLKGINQFIADNSDRLPIEFEILQFKPQNFSVKDISMIHFLISFGLGVNWQNELLRYNLIEKFNDEQAAILNPIESFQSFASYTGLNSISPSEAVNGSNNWVVSGKKSTTGKPLLANDPHLMITIPSIYCEIHLYAPEYHVVGASIAGIPGIIIGHNENIAWGMTNSFADVQDFYIEIINPKNSKQYLHNDNWINFEIIKEEFIVKGKDNPFVKEFRWSRHGPLLEIYPTGSGKIVYQELKGENGLALKHIQNVEGFSKTFSFPILLGQAKNWEDFKDALKLMKIPSQNVVYADTSGNIGYYMSGLVPVRKKGFGIIPVPGWNDEYEWIGYIPFNEMPHSFNPESQFIVTANNKVTPPQYPHFISHDFLLSVRADRIKDLLSNKIKLNIEDFKKIQLDTFSKRAKEICSLLIEIQPRNEEQKEVISLLRKWNYKIDTESTAALIYQVWLRKFFTRVFKLKLGDNLFTQFIPISCDTLYYFNNPSDWLFPGETNSIVENRNMMLKQALDETLEELKEKFGSDMKNWKWGKIHVLNFHHVLSGAHPALEILNRGPYEVPGDGDTVNAMWRYAIDGYDCYGGVSYRQIIDLNDFSKSISIFAPGQSGHPLSDHYADLIDPFLEGKYHPMLFSRTDVEMNAKNTLNLVSKK